MLSEYVEMGNIAFDCPGHQGGQYYRKHPAGRFLYDFFGENIFRSDICNADVKLGDLLIHEVQLVMHKNMPLKYLMQIKLTFVLMVLHLQTK